MSSIVPPLDFIPKLPGKGVNAIMVQLNKQTDKLLNDVSITVKESVKLPNNCKCDDPRVRQIKKNLDQIQIQIQDIQAALPKIQTSIKQIKQMLTVAKSIKAAISAAQLSNPVTAPVFIAMQLTAIQDATIVNAIESLNMLSTVPASMSSKLAVLVPPLMGAISKVSSTCNTDGESEYEIPDFSSNLANSEDYNDLVPTEFYNEYNVSDSDLQGRSDAIAYLLEQQQNLLTSLQEAPSVVHRIAGLPDNTIGKAGDYYIDTNTDIIYGPKLSDRWI
jgi:chaperonin cofactor prefoldin